MGCKWGLQPAMRGELRRDLLLVLVVSRAMLMTDLGVSAGAGTGIGLYLTRLAFTVRLRVCVGVAAGIHLSGVAALAHARSQVRIQPNISLRGVIALPPLAGGVCALSSGLRR